jgi:elongation factor Ts
MTISAKDVKELRDKTGAGMMDCKKALQEVHGDMEKALIFLREKGLAGVQKRAGRIAAQGTVCCLVKDNHGVMIEVNSETDFVAKNDDFKAFAEDMANHVLASTSYDDVSTDDAMSLIGDDSWFKASDRKVSDILADKIATIGENIKCRRFVNYLAKKGGIATYIHGGGKIGVMIEYETESNSDEMNNAVRDVAMHVAAINPSYLSKDSVTADDLKREEEIYKKQVLDQGKPENIAEKIVKGKMGKFYSEVCLLQQDFVKEPGTSVEKYLDDQGKKLGSKVSIVRYARFQVGEGLENN